MTSAVDTNAIDQSLPRAVREQMRRVHERVQARVDARSNPQPPTPPAPQGDALPPAPTASTEDPTSGGAPTPPAPPAPPAPSAADPRESDPVYWKQRFRVTEGMLQRQAEEVRRRDQDITELRDKVRTLEAQQRTTTPPSKVDLTAFFTPEQVERFGEDQCEAMASAAINAARQQAQQLIEAEVAPIRDRAKQTAEQAEAEAEAAFWAKLAEHEPEYEQINARQDWLAWLAQPDESTGLVRQDILDRHRGARNAAGVAKLFRAFKAGLQQRPAPPVVAPRGPGQGDTPPTPPALVKGYPTREEIRDYYKRKALGKVKDAEMVEFEARLASRQAA